MLASKTLESKEEYDIGWITALAIEKAAAIALLDERHNQPQDFLRSDIDNNSYTWGRISNHNVIIASLPVGGYGLINSAKIALRLVSSCPHIKIGLLIGIGAGVPESGRDIRLGDVAVSRPHDISGGVVQYDARKVKDGVLERIGMLVPPPEILLNALGNLQAEHELEDSRIPLLLAEAGKTSTKFAQAYKHPGLEHDHLYESIQGSNEEVRREARLDTNPRIHYGTIGSGNTVVKDVVIRQSISTFLGPDCICLEMEAAGLMNSFPCLVVRGISDYGDANKNDLWQRYASATAAAFTKELLLYVPISDVAKVKRIDKVLETFQSSIDQLNDNFLQTKSRDRTERVNKVLQQLNRHPHEERKDRNLKRVEGTCEWFINHTLFKQWLSSGTSLWVTADPGCGKSVLARYLIDVVLPSESRSVCYFFFKDDFDDQKTASGAGCAMLYQVLTSHRKLITDEVLEMCEEYGPKLTEQFSSLWKILTHFVSKIPGELICVVDALDECRSEDRLEVVRSISGTTNKVKVLVLSRPYFSIERIFDHAGPIIRLSGENDKEREQISKEIDIVLDQRIKDFCKRRGLDSDDHDLLSQKLTLIPQKTYLWAHLTMEILENTPGFTRGNARLTLENIPPTLDAAYEKILQKSVDPSKTRTMLQVILAGKRPFTVAEMGIMLALNGHQSQYSELEEFLEPEARFRVTLREICGLFVIVVDLRVYLLHQTAREFLLNHVCITPQLAVMPNSVSFDNDVVKWKHSFLNSGCHRTLSERCLWLMNVNSVRKHAPRLFKYAVTTWIEHLESSHIDPEDDIFVVLGTTLEASEPNLEMWFATFRASSPLLGGAVSKTGRGQKKILSHLRSLTGDAFPLVMASILDSTALVNSLLVRFPQRWTKKQHSQALWWCMYYNANSTAGFLLMKEADANTMANGNSGYESSTFDDIDAETVASLGFSDTPLYMAVCHDEEKMVAFLLSHEADPTLPCQDDFPLFAAIKRKNYVIIKLLSGCDRNIAILDSQGQTPLHHFIMGHNKLIPHEEILDLLWSPTAENAQYNVDLALHLAAEINCEICTLWCLQHGADVLKEINGMRPLEVARLSDIPSLTFRGSPSSLELLEEASGRAIKDINRREYHPNEARLRSRGGKNR